MGRNHYTEEFSPSDGIWQVADFPQHGTLEYCWSSQWEKFTHHIITPCNVFLLGWEAPCEATSVILIQLFLKYEINFWEISLI